MAGRVAGSFTDNDVETLCYTGLKSKQIEAITEFVKGKDTFVALLMGYGKSLIYAVLPLVIDSLRGIQLANYSRTKAQGSY